MKKSIAILLCVLLLFQLTGCGTINHTNELGTITLVLDWTPNTNHTGIFAAQANGYFEEAGYHIRYLTRDLHHSEVEGNIMTEHEKMFSDEGVPIKYLEATLN